MAEKTEIRIAPEAVVSGLVYRAHAPHESGAGVVLAHGAGAPQYSKFIVRFAIGLAERGLTTLTFNFSYMELKKKLPDRADKLESCYRSVIKHAAALAVAESQRLIIGGKSMGGRIASQVAASGVEGVAGLVFLGYPLHPPGKPDKLRSAHWPQIKLPMLFIQGERDAFGSPEELRPLINPLRPPCEIFEIKSGDHSLGVPKSWPIKQKEIYDQALDEIVRWTGTLWPPN